MRPSTLDRGSDELLNQAGESGPTPGRRSFRTPIHPAVATAIEATLMLEADDE